MTTPEFPAEQPTEAPHNLADWGTRALGYLIDFAPVFILGLIFRSGAISALISSCVNRVFRIHGLSRRDLRADTGQSNHGHPCCQPGRGSRGWWRRNRAQVPPYSGHSCLSSRLVVAVSRLKATDHRRQGDEHLCGRRRGEEALRARSLDVTQGLTTNNS